MKYAISFILSALVLAGCSAGALARGLDSAAGGVEQVLHGAVSAAPSLSQGQGQITPALTAEQARNIALDYLGLSEGQITGLRTELETDDGVLQYDVQFDSGDWEYEFEIQAETGKILSFDKDKKDR